MMFCCLSGNVWVPGKELCGDMLCRTERPAEEKERKRAKKRNPSEIQAFLKPKGFLCSYNNVK